MTHAIRKALKPTSREMDAELVSLENKEIILESVPRLDAESRIDPVGTVGGLRVYVPARMAKDSQFPFRPGENIVIKAVKDKTGRSTGLLVTKQ